MHKRLILAVLSAFALLIGCKDKKEENPSIPRIYFTGIRETDIDGADLGGDTTDWRMDDNWVEQEEALFQADTIPLCPLIDSLEFYPAHPNPATTACIFNFRNVTNAIWHFRLVDEDFNVLWTGDYTDFIPNFNAINLQTTTFPKDTVRLYYQVERGNCQWHGHGDVVIKP